MHDREGMVSIVIPLYNRSDLITETLESVISQTYANWECIIVDDGSTDNSLSVIREYEKRDVRIHTFTRDRDPKGAPTCRNVGLSKAKGEYVIYLDSDDILAPICLEQRVEAIRRNPDAAFLVFKALLFTNETSDAVYLWNIETEEGDLERFLKMDVLWQTTGPIYKRSFLLKMGGFREDLPFWQDFDLHLRCLFSGAKYGKCFEYPPDYFIRTGRSNTISRSTPFAADREVLQLRINYYLGLAHFLKQYPYYENEKARYNYLSMLYYLTMQYFIRFSDLKRFMGGWQQALELVPSPNFSNILIWIYSISLKLSKRVHWVGVFTTRLERRFANRIPDYHIKSKSHLEQVKYVH